MFGAIGIVVIMVMVFGGYMLAGGKLGPILAALPFEMIMIGGAAVGAFLISNNLPAVKHTLKDVGKVFKGPRWKPDDYRDLLCLLFELIRLARANPVGLEEHIENPHDSAIFSRYPRIQHDHETVDLIADTLRAASMNYDDPHQVEEVLDKRVEAALTATQISYTINIIDDVMHVDVSCVFDKNKSIGCARGVKRDERL
jgi:chemotaxis protein MotA